VAGFSVGRRRPSPSPALVHLRKRLSSSTVRPSSCHHVRICTDRERPTPKSARSKQRTYQQRKHSKKWREAGSYWPSKWNGLTGRSLPFATKKMIAHCANKSAPGRRRFGKWKKIIWSSRAHQLLAPPATMTTMTCSPRHRRRPHHEGRRIASRDAVAMDFGVRPSRRPHPPPTDMPQPARPLWQRSRRAGGGS